MPPTGPTVDSAKKKKFIFMMILWPDSSVVNVMKRCDLPVCCRPVCCRCSAGVLPVFCRCSAGVLLVAALVANGAAMAQRQRAAAVVAARAACLQTWAAPSWLGLHTHERGIAVVLEKSGKRRQWQWRSNSGVAAVVRQMAQLRRNSGSIGSSRTQRMTNDNKQQRR